MTKQLKTNNMGNYETKSQRMKKSIFTAVTCLLFIAISGCADVSQAQIVYPAGEHTYGFWGGLWHGFIATFAFIGYLLFDSIAVFAQNNNGGWYTFGFLLGVGAFTGGISASRS